MSNVVEFTIQAVDDFSATMGKLDAGLGAVQKAFMLVAAAYPVVKAMEMTKASLDNAEAMWFAAQRAQTSTENFSAMAWAAKLSNVSTDELSHSMKFLGQAMAQGDLSSAGRELKALGVTAKDPTEAMLQLADAFSNAANDTNKTAIAIELFKRGGTGMVPFLNQGSEAIKQMMQDAIDLGQVIGPDFGASANQINDNLQRMHGLMTGSVNKAMAAMAPVLEQLTGDFIAWSKETDTVNNKAEIFTITLRTLVSAGIGVVGVWNLIIAAGKQLTGTIVAIGEATSGHFKLAMETMQGVAKDGRDANADLEKSIKHLHDIWDDALQSTAANEARALSARQAAAESMKILDEKAAKAHEELVKAIDDATATMGAQVAMFRQSAEAIKIYEFQLKGATVAELAHLVALTATHDGQVQAADNYKTLTTLLKGMETPNDRLISQLKDIDVMEQKLGGTSDELTAARLKLNWELENGNLHLDKLEQLLRSAQTPYEKHLEVLKEISVWEQRLGGTSTELARAKKNEADAWHSAYLKSKEYKDNATSVMKTVSELYAEQQKSLGSIASQTAQMLLNTFKQLSKGIGDAVAGIIVDGANIMDVLTGLLKQIAKSIISSLIEMQVQRVIFAALGVGTEDVAATAKIMAEGGVTYTAAFADSAMMGPEGLLAAPVVAAAAAATAMGNGLKIMNPAAHGGLDYVPAEQTYLLNKGERVLSPNQNQDLTKFIQGGQGGGQTVVIQNLNMHILENATGADVFSRMNKIDLRNKLGQPIIDALNELYKVGKRPNFAMQTK